MSIPTCTHNDASVGHGYGRLEELIPPSASFSGFFSNIFAQAMARCTANAQPGLAVNQWHNGRPTLVPRGLYAGDAVQYGGQGIEVKASRFVGSYQGHNIAAGWLMVLHYALDDTTEPVYERNPTSVVSVMFAKFQVTDWGLGQEVTSQRVSVRGPAWSMRRPSRLTRTVQVGSLIRPFRAPSRSDLQEAPSDRRNRRN